MSRAIAMTLAVLAWTGPASARVGFGDPAEPFREHDPGEWIDPHGQLRLRGAIFSDLDLDRGVSPSTGEPLWPVGETPLDLTAGADLRLRVAPSFFLGDVARVFIEIDVLDGLPLGASPRGAPYNGAPAIVAGTVFQDPVGAALGAFKVRSAVGEVLLPFGVLSAGRAPSHFGLGILANAGDGLDDDGGDRSDRVAFVTPLFGHFFALSYDVAAGGPKGLASPQSPDPGLFSLAEQAASVALLRYRAPWEVETYRKEGYAIFDYGAAFSTAWQAKDAPGFYQTLSQTAGLDESLVVRRDFLGLVLDVWARFVWSDLRFEAEAFASHLSIGDTSPWPGVSVRHPVTGNPFGAVALAEYSPLDGRLRITGEAGVASADAAPGFPLDAPTSIVGARPGDVYGPQIDGKRDVRLDAARLHPAHKVDLILWRTLLKGVSEAAYGRAQIAGDVFDDLTLEGSAIYSHGLAASSTPGGVAPLGLEFDSAATWRFEQFSVRADAGVLFPLGGMGARGGAAPTPAGMAMLRLGYAM